MRTKKSQSHVEMILSFVIFVSFVFFLLVFLNPLKQKEINSKDLDKAEAKIIENLSITYRYLSLFLDYPVIENCFSVKNPLNLQDKIIVKDINGNLRLSTNDENTISISSSPGNTAYILYFSEDFFYPPLSGSCNVLPETDYSFGALGYEKLVLYENLAELNQEYKSNYSALKSSLGLVMDRDFEFAIYNLDGRVLFNETLNSHKIKGSNIFSRQVPLRVIYKNATQDSVLFYLRVW